MIHSSIECTTWPLVPLKVVASFDRRPNVHLFPYVGLEHIASNGVGDFVGSLEPISVKSNTYSFDERHVLFGRLRAYLNKVLCPDFSGHCSTEIFPILPQPTLSRRYLFYWLTWRHTCNKIAATATGARMPRANMDEVLEFEIPLPPLDEQKRITTMLDQAFASLDRARANAEANLQRSRELLPASLAMDFSGKSSWPLFSVAELVEMGVIERPIDGNHGETHPKRADYVESGVPFIMASDLLDGSVDQSSCYFISREQADSLRKGFARDGDLLLSHKGTIGRVAILETDLDYVMLTPQVTYYRVLDTLRLRRDFLYFCLRSSAFLSQMLDIAGVGATRAYIGITRQLDLRLPLPAIGEQARLVAQSREIEACARIAEEHYKKALLDIAALRQSLLQAAFSGQLS